MNWLKIQKKPAAWPDLSSNTQFHQIWHDLGTGVARFLYLLQKTNQTDSEAVKVEWENSGSEKGEPATQGNCGARIPQPRIASRVGGKRVSLLLPSGIDSLGLPASGFQLF